MNALTDAAREEFLTGAIDWLADTFGIAIMVDTYVPSALDLFLDDVAADVLYQDGPLTTPTAADGIADADDLLVTAVDLDQWKGLWVFRDTGVAATSRLVAFFDTQADLTSYGGVVTGSEISVQWNPAGIFRL